jgi:fumarylacetoacetate (FAA) hydrolase
MKLATLKGGRDGTLVVVSHDLQRARTVPTIAATLQWALDNWNRCEDALRQVFADVCRTDEDTFPFDPAQAAAPLPRAYHWCDGSAFLSHAELVRKARGAEMPKSLYTDPLIYQGGSDILLGARDPIEIAKEEWGIDLEAEIAVITVDAPMGCCADDAIRHIKLVTLVNDVSLRNLIPPELAKGFGFYQSKPPTAFAPVVVTPDELGSAWDGCKVSLPVVSHVNGQELGHPNAGVDCYFDFAQLLAHATLTRPLGAGTIIGSGTVSNRDPSVGSSCLAERRMIETIERGSPSTPFLKFGDRVRIEVLDAQQQSVFGAIEQEVRRPADPRTHLPKFQPPRIP